MNKRGRPRKPEAEKRVVMGFSLDPTVARRLRSIAKERGVYESSLADEALKAWLLKHATHEKAA